MRDVDMAPILNRAEWKTRVTGQADFTWTFSPAEIDFKFAGPHVEGLRLSGGQRARAGRVSGSAARRRAAGTGRAALRRQRRRVWRERDDARDVPFRHAVAAAVVSARRHVPESRHAAAARSTLDAEARDAGRRQLYVRGSGARLDAARHARRLDGRGRALRAGHAARHANRAIAQLSYSASGNVAWLNPRRFAAPLEMKWLDDDRFNGSLTGAFTFKGSGRTTDELVLNTHGVARRLDAGRRAVSVAPRSISRWPLARFTRSSRGRSKSCRDRCSPTARSSPTRR